MSYISLKCKHCGAELSYKENDEKATCKHCGSSFFISEVMNRKKTKKEKINVNINVNGQILKTKPEFDISDSALGTLMFIVLSLMFSVVMTVFNLKVRMGTFSYYVLHILVELVFALAGFLVAKIKRKDLIRGAGMNKKVNGALVGWSFLVALVSLLGFGNLTNVFVELLVYFGFSTEGGTIEINNFWQYLGMLVSSCAVAGFSEELLFRGVIQSGFKKWGIKVAVGASAIIFMLMHGSALQTVHQLIIGIVIGYIYYKTNNLWIGVLIHTFNNFIPVTEVYLLTLISKSGTGAEMATEAVAETAGLGTILVDFIVALIVAWAGYYFINLIFKKIIKENEKLNGKTETNESVASISVDGQDQQVEISIDGVPVENESEIPLKKEEKPNISGGTIAVFLISGLYLILEWILGTISRF